MPRITVGVDAGGSSTIAAMSADAVLQRTFTGDPANARSRGPALAFETIGRTITGVLDGAIPDAIVVGAAGAGSDDVRIPLENALRAQFPGARVRAGDDAFIALRAAVPEGDGAVLIAGTGSIAYAESAGTAYRSGGFGYLLGDEGSGLSIGKAALNLMLRSFDSQADPGAFERALARELGVTGVRDTIARVYGDPNPVALIASLARVTIDRASNGSDAAATKIVQNAALELSRLATAILRTSGLAASSSPLVFAGGLLRRNSLLTYLLETRLNNDFPHVPIRKDGIEPYHGALLIAHGL